VTLLFPHFRILLIYHVIIIIIIIDCKRLNFTRFAVFSQWYNIHIKLKKKFQLLERQKCGNDTHTHTHTKDSKLNQYVCTDSAILWARWQSYQKLLLSSLCLSGRRPSVRPSVRMEQLRSQ